MLTKCTFFLLLYAFIFLVISYLFNRLLTLWIANSSSSLSSATLDLSSATLEQLIFILGLRSIFYVKQTFDEPEAVQREKLAELVSTSGQITRDELFQLKYHHDYQLDESAGDQHELKIFSSAKLMEEELDDSEVWLLLVNQNENVKDEPHVWTQLMRQLEPLDLRFARFNCAADRVYCHRRRWHTSQIVLVYPKSKQESEKPRLYNFPIESTTQFPNVIHWLQWQLSSQLSPVDNIDTWLQVEGASPDNNDNAQLVNMVAIMGEQFSQLSPLILSLLAIQFRDRISFGIHFAAPKALAALHSRLQTNIDPRLPIYVISSPAASTTHQRRLTVYNANNYEPLSYTQVETYLRGLHPESSDIQLALFLLLNLYLGLNLFWTRCMTTTRHLRLCFVNAVEVNFTYLCLIIWTPVLGSLLLPQALLCFSSPLLFGVQSLWSSNLAFYFRSQLLSQFGFHQFVIAFLVTGFVLSKIRRNAFLRFRVYPDYDDELMKDVFHWVSAIGCFIGLVLFRKSVRIRRINRHAANHSGDNNSVNASIGQATAQRETSEDDEMYEDEEEELEYVDDIDMDAEMDRMLLESIFSMPNLWLQPELISMDYVRQLPVWQFVQEGPEVGQTVEESANSSSSSTDSSDNEDSTNKIVSQSTGTPSESQASCSRISSEPEMCCKSSKEAPENCFSKMAESCSKGAQTNEHLDTHLRDKLVANRRKIIRIRKRRRNRSNITTAEETPKSEIAKPVPARASETSSDQNATRPKWMLDCGDCSICLDAYRGAQSILGLPCGHNYHSDCVVQWLTTGNHCCPICRWPSYRMKHPRQAKL